MAEHTLTILHFNDVYNIEPQKLEPAGGAARMAYYVKSLQDEKPLVLFSGDALNPSLMSIFLKGNQMIPILNAIPVHCAVYGNHDFDFGVDHLVDFAEQTNFPWLLSNITDEINYEPLANGNIKHMIDWNGTKVGLMGLVEEEWIDTLSTIDPKDVIFEDYVEVGNTLAAELRAEGADIVIALTHMRWPNDRRTAQCIDGIDIVLGGHDHDYNVEKVNGKYIVKSGTDFRNMSKIVMKKTGDTVDVTVECIELDSSIPEDLNVKDEVKRLSVDIDSKMDEYLGNMGVSMDGRFSSIRTMETNLGNFVTDIILEAVPADICLMNSGTFRSDRIHSKGEFLLRDLLTILPLVDPLCVIEISGKGIITALENSVSQYPKLEGRFPQVAGIKFVYDPSKPPGHRVEGGLVKVQGEYVIPDKKYRLCTKEYLASGKDGYDVFKHCPVVAEAERCPSMNTAMRNHFESVLFLLNYKECRSGHRQSLVSIARRTLLVRKTITKWRTRSRSRSSSPSPPPSPLTNNQLTDKAKLFEGNLRKIEPPEIRSKEDEKPVSSEVSVKNMVRPVSPKGSPKKKQRTDTTDGSNNSAITDGDVVATSTNRSVVMTESTRCSEQTSVFRRDSLMTESEHIAQLAKMTQVFVKPAPVKGKKYSHAYIRQMSIQNEEEEQTQLCPKAEGRIVQVDDKRRLAMLAEKITIFGHNIRNEYIIESDSGENLAALASASGSNLFSLDKS